MNNIFSHLPKEVISLIKEYIPKKVLVFTNRENYFLYHSLIKQTIPKYENYIHDVIRRDNHVVFERIINENIEKWTNIKKKVSKSV